MPYKPTKKEVKQSLYFLGVMTGKMTVEEYKAAQPKERAAPVYTESAEQIAFIQWCRAKGYPYNRIYAVENEGKKSLQAGARAKQMGKRAGVCDLFLPVASGGYHGLYIEMKAKGGRLSDTQKSFIGDVKEEGYCVFVCYGSDEAISAISQYCK